MTNCWKVSTILASTNRLFEWVRTNNNGGDTQTSAFLALLLQFGANTRWLPEPGLDRTRVHERLFFQQHSHGPYLAVARNLIT